MIRAKLLRTLSSQSKIHLLVSPVAHAEMQSLVGTFSGQAALFLGIYPLMGRKTWSEPTAMKLLACKLHIAFWVLHTGVFERSIKQSFFLLPVSIKYNAH